MIKTKEQWERFSKSSKFPSMRLSSGDIEELVETIEALREVTRAIPGLFEIAEIAMPDSYFQSDSRLNRMRGAQDALPDWIMEEA